MKRGWLVVFIWLAFAFINLVFFGIVERSPEISDSRLNLLRQGLWICISLNTLYLAIFAHPWTGRISWIVKGAPFFSLIHLLMNLFGILVYYQIGGLQYRYTGLGFVAFVLVHLVFVKWALLSILRPHSE